MILKFFFNFKALQSPFKLLNNIEILCDIMRKIKFENASFHERQSLMTKASCAGGAPWVQALG